MPTFDKLPTVLASYLRRQVFLVAALLAELLLLLANKVVDRPHPAFMDYYWQILPMTCAVMQLVYNLRSGATRVSATIAPGGTLTEAITMSLHRFSGTFDVFNAEMNTLKNPQFWRTLCACKHISRIRIAIPPHVFKRFEIALTSPELREVFLLFDKKVRILPVQLPPARAQYAFAVLNPDQNRATAGSIFVFPKLEPFSKCDTQAAGHDDSNLPRPAVGLGNVRWNYEHFMIARSGPLLDDARAWFSQNWSDDSAYNVKEMCDFTEGNPVPPSEIARLHSLDLDDPISRLFARSDGTEVLDMSNSDLVVRDSSIDSLGFTTARKLRSPGGEGAACVRPGGSSGAAIVWLPPWGYPDWPARMRTVDDRFAESATIIHLCWYSMQISTFTVSGAVGDGVALINDIAASPKLYGVRSDRIILAGVSIGAFVAAQLAATFPDRIVGLCLFAPVIDVFDALDAFRACEGKPLFTRGVYFGKPDHTVPVLREHESELLAFFKARAGPSFVLDLPLRGAQKCNAEFTQANIERFTKKRTNRVLIAASRRDQMTAWEQVKAVAERTPAGQSDIVEIDWMHDISGQRRFLCEAPDFLDDRAWSTVLEFVRSCCKGKEQVCASCGERGPF